MEKQFIIKKVEKMVNEDIITALKKVVFRYVFTINKDSVLLIPINAIPIICLFASKIGLYEV